MALFRKAVPRDPLIISMTGAALGSRVLVFCAGDETMPVDVAAKVGLSGQAVALAADDARSDAIRRRAERRGVFVERGLITTPLPHEDRQFDLVIADDRSPAATAVTDAALLAEAHRVLRPGGRIVVLRSLGRWPWTRRPPPATAGIDGALRQALLGAGFKAAREIGAREGVAFVEAARSA